MLTQKLMRTICSILCGFAFMLSPVQAAYAAPVAVPHTQTAAPAMLNFTSNGHVLDFTSRGVLAAAGDHALRVDFVNANPVQPQSDTPGSADKKPSALSQVTYPDLWDGIRLDYSAQPGSIYTTTYHLSPGTNPATIRLHYNAPLTVNHDGTLGISFKTGSLTESAPIAWQQINGQRVPVTAAFRMQGQDVSFTLGAYNPAYELIIDPSLGWNTFLGGSASDIAMDGSGNLYVSGTSYATWGSPVRAYNSGPDAFVAKLSPSGALLWNTFLGGDSVDYGDSIAVDGSGNVYVTGYTNSTWGAPVHPRIGTHNAYVARLNTSGALVWSTYIQSIADESFVSLALDGSGNIYVTGNCDSTWGTPVHPYTGGLFVARLNPTGALVWNTFLGSNSYDGGDSIVLDGSGNIYVTGSSTATWGTPLRAYTAGYDTFVTRLSSSGVMVWNTFLGGSKDDSGNTIKMDSSGNLYVTGYSSATWGTPVRAFTAGTNTYGYATPDAYVAKLSSSGALLTNTFLGSSGSDYGNGIVRDASDNWFIAGTSDATWGTPLRAYSAGDNAFVAKVDWTVPPLSSSTLISPLAAVTTTKPTFIWSKVSGATYYRLWIKNSSSIWVMQALYYGANICGATNCAITPTPSLVNGAYTWYIQALNTTQSSAWTWHAFSVAIPAPGAVTLVSPKGTTHLAKPTFIWSKDSVATYYRLWIKNASGTWILQNLYFGKNICGVTNCAIVSPITLANGAYTWYIDTLTATQNGQWSAQAITVSVPDVVSSTSNSEEVLQK